MGGHNAMVPPSEQGVDDPQGGPLIRLAYLSAALNAVASVVMVTVLRAGLPGGSDTAGQRLIFIQSHVWQWRVGWLTWNLAALSLLALYFALGRVAGTQGNLLVRLALIFATAGLAGDLSAETLIMGLEPSLSASAFAVAERATLLLTGYLGNGLYTLAGAMLTWSLRRALPRWLVAVAIALWAAGFALSVATLIDSTAGEIVTTGMVMVLFVGWAGLVGRWAQQSAS
jgi:hypothetical protein